MPEIVFAPLVSSPETLGDALTTLPPISTRGHELADTGEARLHFTSSGTGVYGVSITGTGLANLPLFDAFGDDAVSPVNPAYPGLGIARLPPFQTAALDNQTLIPQAGGGTAALPTFTVTGSGFAHLYGGASAALPAVSTYGYETGTGYGVTRLRLSSVGYQVSPITNYAVMYQSPGVMAAYGDAVFGSSASANFAFGTAAQPEVTTVLREILALSPQTFTQAKMAAAIVELMQLRVSTTPVTQEVILELLALGEVVGGNTATVVAIVDALVLSGAATNTMVAMGVVAEALAMRDAVASVHDLTISNALVFAELVEAKLSAYAALVSAAVFSDVAAGMANVTVLVADTLSFDETLSPTVTLIAAIQEGLAFSVGFSFAGEPYLGLSLNATTRGLTTYTNYPFNSMAAFGGQVYGASESGLFRLGGATDAGTQIVWRMRTGMTNFDTGRAKGIDAAYLGYTATGDVLLKCIVVSSSGAKMGYWYKLTPQSATNPRPGRIPIGRGLRSVYWGFELTNETSGDIELDVLELHPVILEGRLP